MRSSRIGVRFVLLASLVISLSAVAYTASGPVSRLSPIAAYPALIASYHSAEVVESAGREDTTPGLKEEIPPKYKARYEQWKKEFLSTEAGREQWTFYQNNDHLTLTITISRENAEGATTGKYKWNDAGQLTAATITLGSRLDDGYPNPIYFPVMNSLVPMELARKIDGSTLAATKIAHEFGHVNRTGKIDPVLYQLQAQADPSVQRNLSE